MNRSDNVNELFAALAKAQGAMRSAKKDADNPFFKSRYADLASVMDALREPLSANGLALVQVPRTEGPLVTVETILGHSSGQFIGGEMTAKALQDTPQGIGSATTYLRRYGAMAVTGLAPDDDDGNAASSKAYQGPPQDIRSEEPSGYNPKNASHKKKLMEKLKGTSVPKEIWEDVSTAMTGRSSDEFAKVVEEVLLG